MPQKKRRSERSSFASRERQGETRVPAKAPPIVLPKGRIRSNGLVAAIDHKGGRKPMEGTPNHFEKLLEGSCPNHAFPVKHLLKDCSLMRKFLSGGSNKGEQGKEPAPATNDTEEKDDSFPMPDSCLMIFGGSAAYDSKCCQKVARREVYMAQPATPPFL